MRNSHGILTKLDIAIIATFLPDKMEIYNIIQTNDGKFVGGKNAGV